MKRILFSLLVFALANTVIAQDYIGDTFKDRRIINVQSVEILPKRKLDVRIVHRFGDIAGDAGGFQSFFGLENIGDVMMGAEYGLSNKLNIGLYRSKGAGFYESDNKATSGTAGLRQLLSGFLKYQLVKQNDEGGSPVTVTLVGTGVISTAKTTENNPSALSSFETFTDRMAGSFQVLLGHRFSDAFSIQLTPAYTHRNVVAADDVNGLFSIGIAGRIQMSKTVGILWDITSPLSDTRTSEKGYAPSVGVGFEFDTGGHIFQVNFTNSKALAETDYIPYTTSQWGEGQFRLGFTISRLFNL